MKRIDILLLVLLLLSIFVVSVNAIPTTEELEEDNVVQGVQEIQEFTEERKWEYLSAEWKEILLKNKFISTIDGFFRKINFIFIFFFGENYDLSLTLFFVVIFWIFFFLSFGGIISTYSAFGKGIAYVIALALSVVVAQFGFLRKLSELVFKIIFYKEGVWGWISFVIFIFAMLFFFVLIQLLLKYAREKRKAQKELKQKFDQKVLGTTVRGVLRGYGVK